MKLSALPQIYRHFNRYREIISVLSKYGLANWVGRLDLDFAKELFKDADGEILARQSPEARLRMAIVELGPTFIKLGQILSTRPDLIGVAQARELECLQTAVHPEPAAQVRATLESELGRPVDEIFSQFEDRPMASASIGQVHRAVLPSGERVAVKVQRHGIENKIAVDLEILMELAKWAEHVPELANYRPAATIAEFQRVLRRELDFTREARHLKQFAQYFADDATVRIPRPCVDLSTSRVLVMELFEGARLHEREALAAMHIDPEEVARRGAQLYLDMIFSHGFYHADPHPGNIVLLRDNVIGLVDFGMVGRIDEQLREDISDMLSAVTQHDAAQLVDIIMRVGSVPASLDRAALEFDVADYVAHYAHQQLDEFNLTGALTELVEMIRRYRIMLPERLALLIKVLVMLEGTSRLLSPKFSLIEVMQPYQRKLAWRQLSPARHVGRLRRVYREVERLAEVLPRGVLEIVQQVQSGRFDVHLDHRGLEPSVNRLVYGMITSALFLGSSLLWSQEVPPLVRLPWTTTPFSLLGAAGCVTSIALGLRLLRAISKSGHLDRH